MSNPFDDPNANRVVVPVTPSSFNPFDDQTGSSNAAARNRNPFDDDDDEDDSTSNLHLGVLTEEDAFHDEIPADAPVEASWQYLGDLPYRRVPIYESIRWGNDEKEEEGNESSQQPSTSAASSSSFTYGLSAFPRSALRQRSSSGGAAASWNPHELRQLLTTSTITKVVGCPYGGPIAAVTLPIVGESTWFSNTEIRIMTNAGKVMAKVDFPADFSQHQLATAGRTGNSSAVPKQYAPADIMEVGFTDRTTLVVILRDSLCWTLNLKGEPQLPPFYLLPIDSNVNAKNHTGGGGGGMELYQATVYEGGAAVLSTTKHAAIVELLDEHDDPSYVSGCHLSVRKIVPTDYNHQSSAFGDSSTEPLPPFCGLITVLPTAVFASENFYSYNAIAVLPRTRTASRHPEVFLSTSDCSVVVADCSTMEMKDLDCRSRLFSPIVEMTIAPNGRFLACFTESSMLTVISATFETKVLDFDTSEGSSQPPLEMRWCGEDSVVLHWKNLGVLMVGPYGDWLRFPYDTDIHGSNLYLLPEMDCCRVVTDTSVEVLQRVPPATAVLLRIGSIEPSAMLLDAADAFFETNDHRGATASTVEEAARAITKTGMLIEAIEGCTEAAAKEFDISTQKRLLRAASFGMHFAFKDDPKDHRLIMGGDVALLEDPSQEGGGDKQVSRMMPSSTAANFVSTSRKLRILNSLRNPSVGFILTSAQYDAISPVGVVARLIALKKPSLATAISKYLSLPRSMQMYARACKAAAFVSASQRLSDTETAEGAIAILNEQSLAELSSTTRRKGSEQPNRGGYAIVAMAASKTGRPGVANLLLMLEKSVSDKIPALVSTGSYADAVAVATTAKDADFIFSTTIDFQKHCLSSTPDHVKANNSFTATVCTKFTPEAYYTLRGYLETSVDPSKAVNLQLRAKKFTDAGMTACQRALRRSVNIREKQATLAEASRLFGLGKDSGFHKSCTDEYLELLKDQEVLRTKYSAVEVAPETSSVTATVSSIIRYAAVNEREAHRLLSDADKVIRKFRIPDKLAWNTKVKAFSETGQWTALKKLADSRTKPPIGFKPFARAAIRCRQSSTDCSRYIERVTDPEERFSLYCEAGMWKRGLEEAAKMRDERRILDVKAHCGSPDLQLKADQILAKIAAS